MQSDYDAIGGHDAVVALTDRFYAHMDVLPEAAAIRALHDDDLTSDRHKLAGFLSGWLGGPPLYWQEFGHPRLRQRHIHVPIDRAARDAWLLCMRLALEEVLDDPVRRADLMQRFAVAADHIRNTPD